MLDPRVQRKGGFGAFAERQQERQDGRSAAEAQAVPAADADALAAVRADVRRAEKVLSRTRDIA